MDFFSSRNKIKFFSVFSTLLLTMISFPAFAEINNGDTVEIKTDDPKADNDIVELCKNINIKILNKKKLEYYLYIKIKK